jgi:hypothetical protein
LETPTQREKKIKQETKETGNIADRYRYFGSTNPKS